jgi:hypothetical protein
MEDGRDDLLPWPLSLLRRLRPDLAALEAEKGAEEGERWFLGWLISNGLREYAMLREDPDLSSHMNGPGAVPGLSRLESAVYGLRMDVQAAFPLPHGRQDYQRWFAQHGIEEHQLACWTAERRPAPTPPQRPYGVNLIGYAFGQLGIGEDLRMAARALQAAGVPFTIIDFPPGPGIPVNDRSMEAHVSQDAPYAINIFCMTAMEHARFALSHGETLIAGRYNIGYWPWELSLWPEPWRDLFRIVDEVWASSRHTYNALAPESPVPLRLMPMAVVLEAVGANARAEFGLPPDAHLFCFSFDLNSSIYRKNPYACIEAFLRAFPRDNTTAKVGLVIKAHAPTAPHPAWERLKESIEGDGRIHVIEQTLDRAELLALYRCCDTFISLHRAEGFGRGIAEALLLNLHVIATAYSGNVDFCSPPQALLVRNKLVEVPAGAYPCHENQVWAEPDIDHAAQRMLEASRAAPVSFCAARSGFSAQKVGERYRVRLQEIALQRLAQTSAPQDIGRLSR